jgi:hypothetical protein
MMITDEKAKRVIRVFPRKTSLTPDDDDVRINCTPTFFDEADEIHVSVLFKNDIDLGLRLADHWEKIAPVQIGGVAFDNRGEEFVPGMYVKKGAVITSRGCPNRCWFCSVWKRDGDVRELKINDGFNILDDNLLACSETHIKSVFDMLSKQKERPIFTGGLEAKLLKEWHAKLLKQVRTERIFFAYDTPEDYEPLQAASKLLWKHGFNQHQLGCYVLIGYKGDSFEKAEKRLNDVLKLKLCPMSMLFMNEKGNKNSEWRQFNREWARPKIVYFKYNQINKEMKHE